MAQSRRQMFAAGAALAFAAPAAALVRPADDAELIRLCGEFDLLEQQAVAGVVTVDDTTKEPADRRFELPNAHAHVLLDDDSEACMKPCAAVVPWMAKAIDIMVEEFRHGTGAAFGLFDLHDLQAAFTRPVFVNHLTQNWLPALPDVQVKLDAGTPVRIAEVGSGEGLAAITIAQAYPGVEVDGFDLDAASVDAAPERMFAREASMAKLKATEVAKALTLEGMQMMGGYGYATEYDMEHDVRTALVGTIYGGTSEIQREIVSKTYGL